MKILIFGIDSLGYSAVESLNLKRLSKRMEIAKTANPKIDSNCKHSHLWSEFYTGKNAYETGAFYRIPIVSNGKIISSSETSGLSYVKNRVDNKCILWNALNNIGLSCGVFGLEHTNVPDKINGFFIPETSASQLKNPLSSDDVYPSDLLKYLKIKNVDLGLRMGYGAFIPNDLNQLEEKVNRHFADWFYLLENLLERYKPDVLFPHSPFITEIIYKFIKLCSRDPITVFEEKLRSVILGLADNFDFMMDRFIDSINPEHLFIVSDHGSGPLDYHVNLNEILYRCGFIKPEKVNLKQFIKPFINPMRTKIIGKQYSPIFCKYDLSSSKFFSMESFDSIYLNDERFTGPNIPYRKAMKISKEATNKLNDYMAEQNLSDKLFFEVIGVDKYIGQGEYKTPLPNIRCYMKDGMFNSGRTNREIIVKNEIQFDESLFKKGFFGEYSGICTYDTLAIYQGKARDMIHMDNLREIYKSILRVAAIKSK